jgi:hypothetical protein
MAIAPKHRIQISISPASRQALKHLAKRDRVPEATKAADLLDFALDIEEDRYFSKLADARLKGKVKWIPDSDKVWK